MQRFWRWWIAFPHWLELVGAMAVVAAAWAVTIKRFGGLEGTAARTIGRFAVAIPRFTGAILITYVAVEAGRRIEIADAANVSASDEQNAFLTFFGVLFGALGFGWVVARVSLHRFYRDQISSCFSIRRDGATVAHVAPTAFALSASAPPEPGTPQSFPQLLISATANVVTPGPDGKKRTYAPFVFGHDRCGIPGVPGASFDTRVLEERKVAAGLAGGKEPLISLMDCVATTGAAVSPSMGMKTVPALRSLFAVINLRLGRWIPNPLSERIRSEVTLTKKRGLFSRPEPRGLGPGYDEFVPELLGLQRADAPRIYLSDGGHYDNLGLLVLLRARCRDIWCVDSEADEGGDAHQLGSVIELAARDLQIKIEIETDTFAGIDGIHGSVFAVGRVIYPGNHHGTLRVIKLGLGPNTPGDIKARRQTDPKFPYHSTFRYQLFGAARMEAYRKLGMASAGEALAASLPAAGQEQGRPTPAHE
jgi:hypothetical protein